MIEKIKIYKYLIKELTIREIHTKYKGSILGILWAILTPIGMLLVFSFVFGEIFQAKWSANGHTSQVDFSINLYIGLSIFWFFADVIGRAPNLIVFVPNFVKKVVFPLEILPVVSLLSGLFHLLINMCLIVVALLLTKGSIHLSVIVVPFVILISIPFLIGVGLLLGSIGVYLRDISALIGVLLNMLMFLSPVFYPLSAIPKHLQWLFELNPITIIIETTRNAFMYGTFPDLGKLSIYFALSLFIWFIGHKVFEATRKGFADVI